MYDTLIMLISSFHCHILLVTTKHDSNGDSESIRLIVSLYSILLLRLGGVFKYFLDTPKFLPSAFTRGSPFFLKLVLLTSKIRAQRCSLRTPHLVNDE